MKPFELNLTTQYIYIFYSNFIVITNIVGFLFCFSVSFPFSCLILD